MIETILIYLLMSTALLAAVCVATRNGGGVVTTLLSAAVFFGIGFLAFALIWTLQGFTTFVAAAIAGICGGRARAMRRIAVSCAVLSYGLVYLFVLGEQDNNLQLGENGAHNLRRLRVRLTSAIRLQPS